MRLEPSTPARLALYEFLRKVKQLQGRPLHTWCEQIKLDKINTDVILKHISLKTRLRIMNAYVSNIFMYNSETWTLTKTLEMKIDIFQRSIS
jgi:hypothetical protein